MFKKQFSVISLACLMLLTSSLVFCRDFQVESSNGMFKTSFGLELSNYLYKEPGLMQEEGKRCGLFGEFCLNNFIEENPFLALQLRYMFGNIDYDGSIADIPIKISGVRDYYLEGRLLWGTIVSKDQEIEFYPYFGVGYRYLYDDLCSTLWPAGYERLQRYAYLPLGIDLVHNFVNGLSLSLNAEYDVFLWGLNTSGKNEFGRVGENYKQCGGYGFRFAGKIVCETIRQVSMCLEPFFRYWDITKSESVCHFEDGEKVYYFEPSNFTQEYGIGFKIKFSF
ncbi:MAG: hypothetical protein LBF23_00185 [Endomicrobium sp.]|jgi:hypothetical protein|nr:hypothetical protein [Endomicrobium sp.]